MCQCSCRGTAAPLPCARLHQGLVHPDVSTQQLASSCFNSRLHLCRCAVRLGRTAALAAGLELVWSTSNPLPHPRPLVLLGSRRCRRCWQVAQDVRRDGSHSGVVERQCGGQLHLECRGQRVAQLHRTQRVEARLQRGRAHKAGVMSRGEVAGRAGSQSSHRQPRLTCARVPVAPPSAMPGGPRWRPGRLQQQQARAPPRLPSAGAPRLLPGPPLQCQAAEPRLAHWGVQQPGLRVPAHARQTAGWAAGGGALPKPAGSQ